jgi:hypothetical protein
MGRHATKRQAGVVARPGATRLRALVLAAADSTISQTIALRSNYSGYGEILNRAIPATLKLCPSNRTRSAAAPALGAG